MLFEEDIFSISNHRAKDREKEQVFRTILRNGPTSQKSMLSELRIRPTDLSNSIRELLSDGMIAVRQRDGGSRRGRPEIKFVAREFRIVAIGVYADSWVLRGSVVDLNGAALFSCEASLANTVTTAGFRRTIESMLNSLVGAIPEGTQLSGIGFSLPGNVDREGKIWRRSGRWPRVRMLRFGPFEDQFGSRVELFRDLDAAMRGSLARRRKLLDRSVLLLHWGVGLGFSYSMRGSIVGSSYGRFGAIGYTRVVINDGEPTHTRSLEQYTNLRFLYSGLRERFPDLTEDERVFYDLLHDAPITDEPVVNTAIEYMVICLQDLAMLFYPDEIMILGPLAENRDVLEAVRERFRGRPLMENMERRIRISVVKGGYEGCLTGATYDLLRDSLRRYLTARF